MVEGKAHPCQAGPFEFEYLGGKTLVLLLHVMKSYFATGGYIILDCGFCFLKGLIQLSKKVIFPVL